MVVWAISWVRIRTQLDEVWHVIPKQDWIGPQDRLVTESNAWQHDLHNYLEERSKHHVDGRTKIIAHLFSIYLSRMAVQHSVLERCDTAGSNNYNWYGGKLIYKRKLISRITANQETAEISFINILIRATQSETRAIKPFNLSGFGDWKLKTPRATN